LRVATQPYSGSPRWPLIGPPAPDSWLSLRRASHRPLTPSPGTRPSWSASGCILGISQRVPVRLLRFKSLRPSHTPPIINAAGRPPIRGAGAPWTEHTAVAQGAATAAAVVAIAVRKSPIVANVNVFMTGLLKIRILENIILNVASTPSLSRQPPARGVMFSEHRLAAPCGYRRQSRSVGGAAGMRGAATDVKLASDPGSPSNFAAPASRHRPKGTAALHWEAGRP
jgi:hypothetical protein